MSYTPPIGPDGKPIQDDAYVAAQQKKAADDLAKEAARQAEYHAAHPLDTSEAGMRSRGVGFATDLTSPGGPWHGLPPEAASDSGSADFAENQRWAIVENGSWNVVTKDDTANIGDKAENVLGYVEGAAPGATLEQRIAAGNDVAYRGA